MQDASVQAVDQVSRVSAHSFWHNWLEMCLPMAFWHLRQQNAVYMIGNTDDNHSLDTTTPRCFPSKMLACCIYKLC